MNTLPPLIKIDKPTRVSTREIMRYVDLTHPSRRVLRIIVDNHACSGIMLLAHCHFTGHKRAALAWHVMRVNDTLPLIGWKIDVLADRHFLIPLSDAAHKQFVERYERQRVPA